MFFHVVGSPCREGAGQSSRPRRRRQTKKICRSCIDEVLEEEGAMRLRCPYHAARLHDIDTSSPPPPSCTITIIIITMHRRHRHPHHLIQSLSSKSSAVADTLGNVQQKQQRGRSERRRREYYFYFASHRKPHFKPDRHRSVTQ